jgi:hypothetical protein
MTWSVDWLITRQMVWFMVFNTIQQYFSISWRSVLLVEETRVHGENRWPAVRHCMINLSIFMKRTHFQLINHTNVDFVGIVDHPCLKENLKIPKGLSEDKTTLWPKEKGQKNYTKHYTENLRSGNTNSDENRGWTQVLLINLLMLNDTNFKTHGNRVGYQYT